MTLRTRVNWGVAGLAGTLGVTVLALSDELVWSTLLARTTWGFADAGLGWYGLLIPDWDASWGAYVLVDNFGVGSGSGSGGGQTPSQILSWFDPNILDIPGAIDPGGSADTLRQALRLITAATAANVTRQVGKVTINDTTGMKNRIVANIDPYGNRTIISTDNT